MRDQIHALEQLQKVDIELKEIEINLEKYPREISNINNELKNVTDSISNKKNNISELEKIKSDIEFELQNNLDSIKKAEEKLFEIKTHKEYEALQKEIAETKRNNSEFEEQILAKMEEIPRRAIHQKESHYVLLLAHNGTNWHGNYCRFVRCCCSFTLPGAGRRTGTVRRCRRPYPVGF